VACDVCGKDEPTEVVTITRQGRDPFVVDLCADDMVPIDRMEEAGSDKPRGGRVRAKPPAHKVIPID
jgi:hypothetical protein